MFSLLITIISIALVAVLAIATIYYGGPTWTQSGVKAQVAKVIAQGQQVSGAVAVFKATQGRVPDTIDELVSFNLLKQIPPGEWTFANDYIVQSTVNDLQCLEANKQLGLNSIPTCDDPSITGVTACCSVPA